MKNLALLDCAISNHTDCSPLVSCLQGDRICDVCKAPINNLPDVPPPPATDAGSDAEGSVFGEGDERNPHPLHGPFAVDQMPGSADVVFDCIRVSPACQISSLAMLKESGCPRASSAMTLIIYCESEPSPLPALCFPTKGIRTVCVAVNVLILLANR